MLAWLFFHGKKVIEKSLTGFTLYNTCTGTAEGTATAIPACGLRVAKAGDKKSRVSNNALQFF